MPFGATCTFVFMIDNRCIYDVKNGEFKVALVKENVGKVVVDTMRKLGIASPLSLSWVQQK